MNEIKMKSEFEQRTMRESENKERRTNNRLNRRNTFDSRIKPETNWKRYANTERTEDVIRKRKAEEKEIEE